MATTSKERIAERRQRIAEYGKIRETLFAIVEDKEASRTDVVGAINALFRLDKEGVPMPKEW